MSAVCSHCWAWALMNILNYFWWTTFWLKDTFDVEILSRFWHFDWEERVSETEICYFLAKMNFKIEEYSSASKWYLNLFIEKTEEHQKKHWYIPHYQVDMNRTVECMKNLINSKNYTIFEEVENIKDIILKKSDGNHMFLFWLDYNNLYWINNGSVEWHIMASIWFEKWNEKISLIDTCPRWEIIYKTYEELVDSIKSIWSSVWVIVISLNEE